MAENFANSFATTLVASIDDTQTSLVVASSAGAPSPNFRAIMGSEIITVTGIAGTTWTVTRGVEGTTRSAHVAGDEVVHVITAGSVAQYVADRYQPLITSDLTIPGDLVVQGSTTLGDAAADTLTINAGTWTIPAQVSSTHSLGVLGTSTQNLFYMNFSVEGNAAGNTNPRAFRVDLVTTGVNAVSTPIAMFFSTTHSGSGTAGTLRGVSGTVTQASANTVSAMEAYATGIAHSGSGNVTTATGVIVNGPNMSGTGRIGTMRGIQIAGLGDALIDTAIGINILNMAGSTVAMRGIQSALTSGTGKRNLYISGTAGNAIAGDLQLASTLSWAPVFDGAADLILVRDAAGVLAQRDGANAQTLRVYGTFTDASNYERLRFSINASQGEITTEGAGTGVARALLVRAGTGAHTDLGANSNSYWRISGTVAGALLAISDNAYDIGASGANRPRSLYWGTQALAPDGTAGAPSISFALDADVGFYRVSGNQIGVSTGAGLHQKFGTTFFTMGSDVTVGWHADTALATSTDLVLLRDAAGTLAQRNGLNAQDLRVYGTYTDGSNWQRLRLTATSSAGGTGTIAWEGAGTGSAGRLRVLGGDLAFNTAATDRWNISATGHFLAFADNSYDIGATGANRPRALYLASQLVVQGAGPHSVGGSTDNGRFLYIRGSFAGSVAVEVSTSLTQTANSRTILQRIGSGSTVTIDGVTLSGTNGPFALLLNAPTIAFANLGAATTAATLRVETAPAGATNNYGAWITGDVRLDNALLGADGTVSAPSYSFFGQTNTGFYRPGASVAMAINGSAEFYWDANEFRMASDVVFGWVASATDTVTSAGDLVLARDAANTLAQRNGANSQELRIYGTHTDASNYERLQISTSPSNASILTQNAGTGSAVALTIGTTGAQVLAFRTSGTNRWQVNTGGPFVPGADNTYDFGTSANRARTIYWGTQALAPDGTTANPSYSFANRTNYGFFLNNASPFSVVMSLAGVNAIAFDATATAMRLGSNMEITWSSTTDALSGAADLAIFREAANTLAQRNGLTAQIFHFYNTFTDASNYERLDLLWTSNVMFIQTANGGTGTLRDLKLGGSSLYFRSNGSDRARFDTSGHLIWVVDNGLDIGASGANRPRTGYFGTSVSTPAVAFPATQVASADANTLDDYEEGTWTPALTFSTPGDLAVTYTTQAGRYQKIGNRVYCSMEVITSSFTHTTAAGTLRISGLPFAVGAVGNGYRGAGDFQGITKANFTQFTIQPNPSTSICTFGASGSAQALANVSVGDVPTGGSVILRFTFSYETA